jgi:hypothetical protein
MDEIGRGTSTFDGLSLAWAIARYIATRLASFTLFATHYFELTTLAQEVEGCVNVHLDATEHGDGIVFLHAVKEGPANRSYGLQVAQLAGVPHEVIAQARHYLETLEAERDTRNVLRASERASLQHELPLIPPAPRDPVAEELRRKCRPWIRIRSRRARRTRRSTGCVRLLRNPAKALVRSVMRKMPVREKAARLARDARREQHSQVTHGQRDVIAGPGQPRLADRDAAIARFTESHDERPSPTARVPAMMPRSRAPDHSRRARSIILRRRSGRGARVPSCTRPTSRAARLATAGVPRNTTRPGGCSG